MAESIHLETVGNRRAVLEGVPRIHFYEGGKRCPEDICFPSVMRALMEYLGENQFGCRHCDGCHQEWQMDCSYSYFVGVSGAAAFFSWTSGWIPGFNIDGMSADPAEPFNRAFAGTPYAHEWVVKDASGGSEDRFRRAIIESIDDRKRPVIAFGLIGPPEACLITGYDDGGDIVIGWNFFQKDPSLTAGLEFEPSGYFRKRNWFQDTSQLILVGDRRDLLPMNVVYPKAVRWLLEVTRTEQVQGLTTGLAAYTAWADDVQRDGDFPTGDDALLRQRHDIHNISVGNVAEARWYGSQFLLQAANRHLHYSLAEDLMHAAACYAAEHALMWNLWDLAGGNGNPDAYLKFADPNVRRQMVPIILEARRQDALAAEHMERALSKTG